MEERKGNMELGPSMIINLRGRGWGWFWRFGFGWTRIVRGPRPSSGASLGFLVKGSGTQARHRVPSGVPAFCTNSGAARHRKQPCAGSGRHGEGQGNSFCSTCHKYVMRTSRDADLGRDVGHAWLWQVPTARSWFNWWGPKNDTGSKKCPDSVVIITNLQAVKLYLYHHISMIASFNRHLTCLQCLLIHWGFLMACLCQAEHSCSFVMISPAPARPWSVPPPCSRPWWKLSLQLASQKVSYPKTKYFQPQGPWMKRTSFVMS